MEPALKHPTTIEHAVPCFLPDESPPEKIRAPLLVPESIPAQSFREATIEARANLNRCNQGRDAAFSAWLRAPLGSNEAAKTYRDAREACDRAKDLLIIMQEAEIKALRRLHAEVLARLDAAIEREKGKVHV